MDTNLSSLPARALRYPVQRSRWLVALIVLGHLAAAGAALTLPVWAAALTLGGLGLSAGLQLRRETDKGTRVSMLAIAADGGLAWIDPDGAARPVIDGRILGERWIALRLGPVRPAGRTQGRLIAPDALAAAAFPALRRAVLHGLRPATTPATTA